MGFLRKLFPSSFKTGDELTTTPTSYQLLCESITKCFFVPQPVIKVTILY